MHKLKRDTYAVVALRESGVWDIHRRHWTREQWLAVGKCQAEMRGELGLPTPQARQA